MNKLVMFKKYSDDGVNNTENITMITSSKKLEEFKELFDKSVADFVAKIRDLSIHVNESNNKLTQDDYDSEEITENMKVFSEYYNAMEKFKENNYIFEFEGQYIDMKKWFWNDEFFYEYEIYYLEDFVKMKLQDSKLVPEYSF